MSRRIQQALLELETSRQIRILYACESGSRAWGFASQDSDWDVRFIYIHRPEWYLTIHPQRDVIEQPMDTGLDLAGWDIRKALMLFRKSNPPMLEWLSSPIVYRQSLYFAQQVRDLLPGYFSPRASMYHYLSMARGNFRDFLQGETVWTKKYFYVLRPVLACKWLEVGLGAVPMEFEKLARTLDLPPDLVDAVDDLLAQKRSGAELSEGPRVPAISNFLESELARLQPQSQDKAEFPPDLEPLNQLFRKTLTEAWAKS